MTERTPSFESAENTEAPQIERRNFLKALGIPFAAALTTMAGCTEDNGPLYDDRVEHPLQARALAEIWWFENRDTIFDRMPLTLTIGSKEWETFIPTDTQNLLKGMGITELYLNWTKQEVENIRIALLYKIEQDCSTNKEYNIAMTAKDIRQQAATFFAKEVNKRILKSAEVIVPALINGQKVKPKAISK